MVNGKKKGKNGELEVARFFRAHGYDARRSAQFCGNNEEGTADVVGVPGIHIEVKRVERLNLDAAMDQATRDAGKTTKNIPGGFPSEKQYQGKGNHVGRRLDPDI